MALNINRFLTNAKKNPDLNKLIKAIDNKYPQYNLGANTPFPNQALSNTIIAQKEPCLYFSKTATKQLEAIRDLAHQKSMYRLKNGKEDKPIEFICVGYLDHDADIVINKFIVPAEIIYSEQKQNVYENILKHTPSKDISIETMCLYYEYLKHPQLKDNIGLMPIAFLGTTRPIIESPDMTQYCPKISEIARAIVPANIDFDHPIMSGTISISPRFKQLTPKGYVSVDGSLECILIKYKANPNQTLTPISFSNITQCQQCLDNDNRERISISRSYQPLDNLPVLSEQIRKK